MSEKNKEVVRRCVEEIWNQKNLDAIDQLYAPDFVNHDPNDPEVRDRNGLKQWAKAFFAAFPDEHVVIKDLIAEGDKVVKFWMSQGTHQGEMAGIAPTGKQVSVSGITIYRVVDGKIAECVWSYDALGMMQQLEAIPQS